MALLVLLKIAGICLLVLLVLLLIAVLLLLTVPFRYELSEKSQGKHPEGKLMLSWLWRGILLRLEADPQEVMTGELKLFGYRYLRICYRFRPSGDDGGEETVEDIAEETAVREPETGALNCLFDDTPVTETETVYEKGGTDEPEGGTEGSASPKTGSVGETGEESESTEIRERIRKRRKQRRDRLEVFLNNVWNFLRDGAAKLSARIKEDVEKLKNSSEGLTGKLKELWNLYKSGEYRTSIHLLKEQLFRILKEILPRSGTGTIEYGAGDPYTTGKILEALAFFYPLYGKTFQVIPFFEEKKLDTDITVQGRICLGVILVCLVKTVMDQGLRELAKETRRIIREA